MYAFIENCNAQEVKFALRTSTRCVWPNSEETAVFIIFTEEFSEEILTDGKSLFFVQCKHKCLIQDIILKSQDLQTFKTCDFIF